MLSLRLAFATVLMVLCLAGGAVAKSYPLYPEKVDLHFVDAAGKVRTVTITQHVRGPMVGKCSPLDEQTARHVILDKRPELYAQPYLGTTCHGAKPPRLSNAKPQTADDRPAMVVLFFIDADGRFHYSSFNRRGKEYRMDSCPLIAKKTEAALLKQVKADHVGQEFRGASCFLQSTHRTSFENN
jgi:hypothetical protein